MKYNGNSVKENQLNKSFWCIIEHGITTSYGLESKGLIKHILLQNLNTCLKVQCTDTSNTKKTQWVLHVCVYTQIMIILIIVAVAKEDNLSPKVGTEGVWMEREEWEVQRNSTPRQSSQR